ncbi:hypothetical protein UFOVP1672_11 [uncultured Caudovirales phage]|uniref:Uncharacterized protein n=1 Tax=uncultured Caudovirales phage TaxID=2100421 RepID=A0A6J5Q4H0_9CAUD|nr:hypothetical protein UFOVP988_33 [uncultured Caudovirales phage]CAB4210705.1 hypothetical protein UFOVP1425_33 [uncultured Caudovirales phage]CAB4223283.1 hypothetical protein UFOVP1672_11 [uncultured Caudovirales phage]
MAIILDGANDKIQVVTAGSGAFDTEVQVSWAKNTLGTITVSGDPLASITSATTTDIIAAAGASNQINVRGMSFRNNHASDAVTVTVQETDGTNTVVLMKTTLAAGESLIYGENGVWVYYDATAKPYMGLGPLATQADMEAGSSASVVVTPSVQHYHPSACKFWVKTTPGNNNVASYNVTSVSDTSAGITVVTIATDFSSAAWACGCSVESTSDTMTVTNLKFARIGLADQAAGSVSIECHDLTAITAVIEDPTAWHVWGYGDQ